MIAEAMPYSPSILAKEISSKSIPLGSFSRPKVLCSTTLHRVRAAFKFFIKIAICYDVSF